jgi:hypothetical protein
MAAFGGKADVHASVTFLVFSYDCSASGPDIGFNQLAPIICRTLSILRQSALAITRIEKSDEISSNQTTDKTRASVDTSKNQGSSEGTGRIEACRPALKNQEKLSRITFGWHQEKPGRLVSSQTRLASSHLH